MPGLNRLRSDLVVPYFLDPEIGLPHRLRNPLGAVLARHPSSNLGIRNQLALRTHSRLANRHCKQPHSHDNAG